MLYRILVITDDPTEAGTLRKALGKARGGPFAIEWERQLCAGLERLNAGGIDAIIASMSLPNSSDIGVFEQLSAAAPNTPIMTLCGLENEALAIEAVQSGIRNSQLKNHFVRKLIPQTLRNSIQQQTAADAYHTEKARAESALNSISDAVICTDLNGNINYLNIAAEQLTGWPREEARERPIDEVLRLINGVTREAVSNPVKLVIQKDEAMALDADTLLIRRDGSEVPIEDSASPIHDWDGQLTGAVMVFHDVTAAQAISLKMAHLAQHDFLTDLPNRVLLNDRITQAINSAKRSGTQLAVLFLDLDNFKRINDTLGHAAGDKLLQSVSQRLRACVRSSDTVSRQGGDEFVILLTGGKYGEQAALTADKILAELNLPHAITEGGVLVSTSIGISLYPADGTDAETLIKNADNAMYKAKQQGRNNFQFFRSGMNVHAPERQIVEAHLQVALHK